MQKKNKEPVFTWDDKDYLVQVNSDRLREREKPIKRKTKVKTHLRRIGKKKVIVRRHNRKIKARPGFIRAGRSRFTRVLPQRGTKILEFETKKIAPTFIDKAEFKIKKIPNTKPKKFDVRFMINDIQRESKEGLSPGQTMKFIRKGTRFITRRPRIPISPDFQEAAEENFRKIFIKKKILMRKQQKA